MRMLEDVIIKPVISEASMDMAAQRKYVFKVARLLIRLRSLLQLRLCSPALRLRPLTQSI